METINGAIRRQRMSHWPGKETRSNCIEAAKVKQLNIFQDHYPSEGEVDFVQKWGTSWEKRSVWRQRAKLQAAPDKWPILWMRVLSRVSIMSWIYGRVQGFWGLLVNNRENVVMTRSPVYNQSGGGFCGEFSWGIVRGKTELGSDADSQGPTVADWESYFISVRRSSIY